MKERPILFSGPMVNAILDDGKTQTRRVVKWKERPELSGLNLNAASLSVGFYCTGVPTSGFVLRSRGAGSCWNDRTYPLHCPYGQPGDRLWVRETWQYWENGGAQIAYRADLRCFEAQTDEANKWSVFDDGFTLKTDPGRWRPSIFMPRWASRVALEITQVRVQRVQEISKADAVAEGCRLWKGVPDDGEMTATHAYVRLWDSVNAKRGFGWDVNPWVWVVSFKRVA